MPNTKKSLSVIVRSDEQGHWVEWTNDGETGFLGPYRDETMAQTVRNTKERELAENVRHINDA